MQNSFNVGVSLGDRVRVTGGEYKGATGVVVNTRGAHISQFVMVQLDRGVKINWRDVGLTDSSPKVGISTKHIVKT